MHDDTIYMPGSDEERAYRVVNGIRAFRQMKQKQWREKNKSTKH